MQYLNLISIQKGDKVAKKFTQKKLEWQKTFTHNTLKDVKYRLPPLSVKNFW
jgi:hypothetical protein